VVQIGIFGHTARARALLARLRGAGVEVREETRVIGGKRLWIFTAGPYADPTEARRVAADIDRRERLGCRVAEFPPASAAP
jgi:cell division septation protein DedD